MNDELMHRLECFLAKEEHDTLRGKPALAEEISAAEEKLNVEFHDNYKAFIKRFGGAYAGIPIHAFSNGTSIGKETVIVSWSSFFGRPDKGTLNSIGRRRAAVRSGWGIDIPTSNAAAPGCRSW